MKKKFIFRLAFLTAATFSLHSCRTEDELNHNPQKTVNRFQIFTSRNGEPVNYPLGYKILLERYDSIYSTAYTRKALLKNNILGKSVSEEYVEFNIRSQELMMKNGNERWILYPVAKGKEVIGIEVGILKNKETELEFWRMDSQDAYYKEIIDLFRLAYSKKILAEQAMSKGGNCGYTGEEPCDTGEVIIHVPRPNGPKGDPNLYLPGQGGGGSDPGVIGGDCGVYGNCGDGGGNNAPSNPEPPEDPCKKTKDRVNKPQVKDSLTSLKNHAHTNTKEERGFQELKSGTLQPGTVTEDNQMFFGIGSNSLGTVHTHQPGTIGILAPQDIMTFLDIVREQDPNSLGNAYSGTVSSSGTYFINFTGTASDLPPAMTEAQEAAYIVTIKDFYVDIFSALSIDSKYTSDYINLNQQGLEILLFKTLEKMNLKGKIELIKEENGNTSTIKENTNGTTTPNPC